MRLGREIVLTCLWLGACADVSDQATIHPTPIAAGAPAPAPTHGSSASWAEWYSSLEALRQHTDFVVLGSVSSVVASDTKPIPSTTVGVAVRTVLWQRDPKRTLPDTVQFQHNPELKDDPAVPPDATIIVCLTEFSPGAYRVTGGPSGRFEVKDGKVTAVVPNGVELGADVNVQTFRALLGSDAPDLPAGWEDAEPIADLMQNPCADSALASELKDTLRANVEGNTIVLAYDHAHFRCVQDVEAFAKRSEHALEVLVQPVEMHPHVVAGCDCLYDINMRLESAPGALDITLYRRWDALNEPNDPVSIGSVKLEMP